jgi:SPP1 family predicted phage head-tail adaptor
MRAGRLRHRIRIEQPVKTQNPTTGALDVVSWQTVPGCDKLAAAIEPLSTRDFISAQAQQSEVRARIVIRHRQGLTSAMRAVHNNVIYYFAGTPLADQDSGLEYLTIPVEEGVIVPTGS